VPPLTHLTVFAVAPLVNVSHKILEPSAVVVFSPSKETTPPEVAPDVEKPSANLISVAEFATAPKVAPELNELAHLEETKTQYKKERAAEYPSINDYIDGVVKGDQAQIQAYIDACLAVKAKYPKP